MKHKRAVVTKTPNSVERVSRRDSTRTSGARIAKPPESCHVGKALMIEKQSDKVRELKRVDSKSKSIIAAVDKIIAEVPIEERRVKTDLVKAFLEDRE